MKTNRTIRLSSLVDGDLIFDLPRQWSDLTNTEIRTVFRLMAITDKDKLLPTLFARLTYAKTLQITDSAIACLIPCKDGGFANVWIDYPTLHNLADVLNFVFDPGNVPVRFSHINGREAVDASFHGVTFGEYIRVEALYQGYLSSHDNTALVRIANILYRPGKKSKPITELRQWQILMILSWITQVKGLFSSRFTHFFRPAGTEDGEVPPMVEIIDNEIRALTGGDVSKEDEILAIDCWRALTELNFKAQETEEYNRRMAKYKS